MTSCASPSDPLSFRTLVECLHIACPDAYLLTAAHIYPGGNCQSSMLGVFKFCSSDSRQYDEINVHTLSDKKMPLPDDDNYSCWVMTPSPRMPPPQSKSKTSKQKESGKSKVMAGLGAVIPFYTFVSRASVPHMYTLVPSQRSPRISGYIVACTALMLLDTVEIIHGLLCPKEDEMLGLC